MSTPADLDALLITARKEAKQARKLTESEDFDLSLTMDTLAGCAETIEALCAALELVRAKKGAP